MSSRTGMNASGTLMKRYFEWERAGKLMLYATRYRLIIQCIHKLVQGRAHFRERILFHGNNLTGSVRGSLGQINGISRKLTLDRRRPAASGTRRRAAAWQTVQVRSMVSKSIPRRRR